MFDDVREMSKNQFIIYSGLSKGECYLVKNIISLQYIDNWNKCTWIFVEQYVRR